MGRSEGYSRRDALRIFAYAGASTALAACVGRTGDPLAGTDTGPPAGTETLPATATATSSPSRQLSGSLSAMYDYDYVGPPGTMQEFWEAAFARFEETRGVEIEGIFTPFAELNQRINSYTQANSGPEFLSYYANLHLFPYVHQDVVTPLSDHLDEAEMEPWLLKSIRFNGKQYHAPFDLGVQALAVNIDLLEQADIGLEELGATDGSSNRLESWEAWLDVLDRLRAAGITPIAIGNVDTLQGHLWNQTLQGEFVDDPVQLTQWDTGRSDDETVGMAWIDRASELATGGYLNPEANELNQDEAFERFVGGEAAFNNVSGGQLVRLDADRFAIMPYWEGAGAAYPMINAATGGMIVSKFGDNTEAGIELIRFFHEGEQLDLFHEITGQIPSSSLWEPPSDLHPLTRRTFEFLTSEPEPYWTHYWHHVSLHFDVLGEYGRRALAGDPPDRVKSEFVAAMEQWRRDNAQLVAVIDEFIDAVEAN